MMGRMNCLFTFEGRSTHIRRITAYTKITIKPSACLLERDQAAESRPKMIDAIGLLRQERLTVEWYWITSHNYLVEANSKHSLVSYNEADDIRRVSKYVGGGDLAIAVEGDRVVKIGG